MTSNEEVVPQLGAMTLHSDQALGYLFDMHALYESAVTCVSV